MLGYPQTAGQECRQAGRSGATNHRRRRALRPITRRAQRARSARSALAGSCSAPKRYRRVRAQCRRPRPPSGCRTALQSRPPVATRVAPWRSEGPAVPMTVTGAAVRPIAVLCRRESQWPVRASVQASRSKAQLVARRQPAAAAQAPPPRASAVLAHARARARAGASPGGEWPVLAGSPRPAPRRQSAGSPAPRAATQRKNRPSQPPLRRPAYAIL
jgi:hypothetical protein